MKSNEENSERFARRSGLGNVGARFVDFRASRRKALLDLGRSYGGRGPSRNFRLILVRVLHLQGGGDVITLFYGA